MEDGFAGLTDAASILLEEVAELLVAELAYPAFAGGYGHFGKTLLALDQIVYFLLETVFGNETLDLPRVLHAATAALEILVWMIADLLQDRESSAG